MRYRVEVWFLIFGGWVWGCLRWRDSTAGVDCLNAIFFLSVLGGIIRFLIA